MEVLHAAPESSSFVLLAEHQARTPASFYSGPPVLHYHSKRCKVVILERDLRASPALNAIRGTPASATMNGSGAGNNATTEGGEEVGEEEEKNVVIDGVDVWVTSDKFLLYVPATSTGVSIPYPSISLHAIQRLQVPDAPNSEEVQGLYMQIATDQQPAYGEEEEDESCITLTLVPPTGPEMLNISTTETTTVTSAERVMQEDFSDKPDETPTQMLYAAVSACSNLHPDPPQPGEEDDDQNALFQSGFAVPGSADGGLPPPVDGSSGWITAENMHEYFDEEGNWIAGGEAPSLLSSLGPGAGSVRSREQEEDDQEGADGEETKWRRTD